MSQTPCPSCGAAASGPYCAGCGAAIAATCRACDRALPAGARFCNECGAPVSPAAAEPAPAGAPAPASRLPWYVAGAALVALVALVVVPRLGDAEPPPAGMAPFATAAPAGAGPQGVDLSSMSPREAADRLFNRVMSSVAAGDVEQVGTFLPMALQAYAAVQETDADLYYHLGELHLVNGDPASARAAAEKILAGQPTHLFGLHTAARARAEQGDREGAAALYRRFLENYTMEVTRDLPEYRDHAQALPSMRAQAEQLAAP
jgi:tetratricopeptide (TPR) repeat protein